MRRDHRPFVVEVRRGQKKGLTVPAPSPAPEASPADDMMRRAEAALFGRTEETKPGASEVRPLPARRILEVLPAETAATETPRVVEPPRRGRKPGSRNRPKSMPFAEPAQERRRRGRPPKSPEGKVRSVTVTPELANAALEIMARVAATPVPVTPLSRSSVPPAPLAPKRRGRPPKIAMTPPTAGTAGRTSAPSLLPETAGTVSARSIQRIVERYGADALPRLGQRWTRRLRGFANPEHLRQRMARR